MTLETKDFRKALGSFTTGICNITTYDIKTKKPIGITINSLTSVSLDPPLILFCLDQQSHVFPYFQNNDHFCVNILSHSQKEISIRFSDGTKDPWQDTEHSFQDRHFVYLKNSLTHIQCKVTSRIDQGDHRIIFGEVLKTDFNTNKEKAPLVYHKGSYSKII